MKIYIVCCTMLQAERSQFRDPKWWINFLSIYLILPAALWPGVYSASNINEYQEQKNNILGRRALPARKADNLAAVCEPIVCTMWDRQQLTTL
jgi:hypothetical protein